MKKNSSTITVNINTTISKLWKVLTAPEYSTQYMFNCAVESDWKLGNSITWKGNYQGYDAFQKGEILDIKPEELIKYSTFDPNFGLEDIPDNYIHVTYLLVPKEDNVELTIINETFDGNEERMGHINGGWKMVVDKIKSVAQTLK